MADFLNDIRDLRGTDELNTINSEAARLGDATKAHDLVSQATGGMFQRMRDINALIGVNKDTVVAKHTELVGDGTNIGMYEDITTKHAEVGTEYTKVIEARDYIVGADGTTGAYATFKEAIEVVSTEELHDIAVVADDITKVAEDLNKATQSDIVVVGNELLQGAHNAVTEVGTDLRDSNSTVRKVAEDIYKTGTVAGEADYSHINNAYINADIAATKAGEAVVSAADANTAKIKAEAWADNASDEVVEVVDGVEKYSAKKHALDAEHSATVAQDAKDTLAALKIGNVSSVDYQETANVSLTADNKLDFVLRAGAKGVKGDPFVINAVELINKRVDYNPQPKGYAFLSLNGYGPQPDETASTNWEGVLDIDASTTLDWDGADLELEKYVYKITVSDMTAGSAQILDDDIVIATLSDNLAYEVVYKTVHNTLKITTDADWDGNIDISIEKDVVHTSLVFFKTEDADGDYWSEGAPFGVGDKGDTGVSISSVTQYSTTNADGEYGKVGAVDTYKVLLTNGDYTLWDIANGNEYTDTDAIAAVEGKDGLVAKLSADSTAITPADDAVDEAIATKKYVLDNVAKVDEAGEIVYDSDTNTDLEATVDETNVQSAIEKLDAATKLNTAKETNTVTDLSVVLAADKVTVESSDGANADIVLADEANDKAGLVTGAERVQVTTNKDNIATLNGDATVDGSVDKKIADNNTAMIVDEDDLASDSDSKVPTQQSVKAYVETRLASEIADALASEMSYKGGYDVSANEPNLDDAPAAGTIAKGDTYTATTAGDFYGVKLAIGDMLIANEADADTESKWTIVNRNLEEKASEITVVATGNLGSGNVQDALEELQGDIDTLNADDTVDGSVDTKVKALADGQVTTNKNDIATLNADVDTAGSVHSTIKTDVLDNYDTDGTLDANSDSKIATQKAVKTYVDTAIDGKNDAVEIAYPGEDGTVVDGTTEVKGALDKLVQEADRIKGRAAITIEVYTVENDGDTEFAIANDTSKEMTVLIEGYPTTEYTRDSDKITLDNGADKNEQIHITAYNR